MAWISWSRTWAITKRTTTTSRKPLRCSSKILRWKRMYLLLRVDQRLKRDHKDVLLPTHLQKLYLSVKDLGLTLSQKNIRLSLTQCQNHWVLFFVMVIYLEKKMERLNSWDQRIIFGTILCTLNIGLMKCGRVQWQETEETRKDFNIVLIRQDKKWFISELFKVIQDAVSFYKTMSLFRTISSSTFITSDVRSIYTRSRIQDWYREDKLWAKDRRYSSRLWILWTKNTEIRTKLTWKHRVLHGTIRKSGRNIKTRCIGSKERIQVLSNTIERNHPLRHTPRLLYPEGYHDGNWRNHIRESMCVTSTSSEDFL